MAASNDGGPAFPHQSVESVPDIVGDDGTVHSWRRETVQLPGMSLRDWFAGQVRVPETLSDTLVEKLTGKKHPGPDGWSPERAVEIAQFWAAGEAAYRYLHADAILAARSKPEAA
jgi:hypothetical protein